MATFCPFILFSGTLGSPICPRRDAAVLFHLESDIKVYNELALPFFEKLLRREVR